MKMKDVEILKMSNGPDLTALTPEELEELEAVKKRIKAIEKKGLEDFKNGKIKKRAGRLKDYIES